MTDGNGIEGKIRDHLKLLVKTAGLPGNEDSLKQLENAWMEKMEAFDSEVESRGMEVADSFFADDERGALLMTYSGSLITLGPMVGESRSAAYRSIGIRNDVPESIDSNAASLSGDVEVDSVVSFIDGPIEKSSPIFKIAVISSDMAEEEQEELLAEATRILTESFVDVNKTIIQ
ncbi:hypothetical protein [Sediminispirochaeta bajacaliforniensis]|uniref:hypothetical protein n=1 Tax=Sediminispirochaeta bajacaliforniensis TaxID=148 RepID=UPI000364EAD3|nr:hypothetical protein [Sediminispirochaeta bajacaliforniensis]